ncbi:MAG TPA: tetratricopeptide repeat protein [Gaiellaceae bacterium]
MPIHLAVGSTISDIASLWILALVVALTFILWLYREPLREAIREGRLRFRHKHTEFDTSARPLSNSEVKQPAVAEPVEETPQEVQDAPKEAAVTDSREAEAKPSFGAAVFLLREGNATAARETFDALQAQEDDEAQRLKNELSFAAARAMWGGDTGAIRELEERAHQPKISAEAHRLRGVVLAHAGIHDEALAAFEASAAVAEDDVAKAEAVAGAATALDRLDRLADAVTRVEAALVSFTDDSAKAMLYEGLADLFEIHKDWQSRAAALEAVIVARPTDPDLRFRLGYSYAQAERHDMALLHYDAALLMRHDHWTQNNIGVAYERLDMSIRSISSYQAAWKSGNTLAAANLALTLIYAGFADQARSILSEASTREKVDPQVGERMANLAKLEEAQEERKRTVLEKARRHSIFFREFATAKWASGELKPGIINGRWFLDEGVDAEIKDLGRATETDEARLVTVTWTRNTNSIRVSGPIHNHAFELTHETLGKPVWATEPQWTRRGDALGYCNEPDGEIVLLLLESGEVLKLMRPPDVKGSLERVVAEGRTD